MCDNASMSNITKQPTRLAALDLGSNSFHLIIAGLNQGEVRIKDKISEKVQLGAGIGPDKRITEEAQDRALACLQRYSERLQGIPKNNVRVVGTNALRKAKNSKSFLKEAEQILGYNIDIIAGREEARLIYLGVSHTQADDKGSRLVIDIGGGSTEFIIGCRFEAQITESLHMGCVSYAQQYFDDGISERAFTRATMAAKQQIIAIRKDLLVNGWDSTVGASGTIRAITNLLRHQELVEDVVRIEHLYQLKEQILQKFNSRHDITMEGLSEKRGPVLPSGLAILIAIFESLNIKSMRYSNGALREGLLYDMLGRIEHEDVRDRTVKALMDRYHVSHSRAERVKSTALQLLDSLGPDCLSETDVRPYLGWAAELYQIGLSVSHTYFQKHGAYLIKHSDLPGFTRRQQAFLAALVNNHRRSYQRLKQSSALYHLRRDYVVLSVCLRLALIIQRGYSEYDVNVKSFTQRHDEFTLELQSGWREENTLLETDIEQEIDYLRRVNIKLKVN